MLTNGLRGHSLPQTGSAALDGQGVCHRISAPPPQLTFMPTSRAMSSPRSMTSTWGHLHSMNKGATSRWLGRECVSPTSAQ